MTARATANLEALGRVDPALLARLQAAPPCERLRTDDGVLQWWGARTPVSVVVDEVMVSGVVAAAGDAPTVVLLGAGAGPVVEALLTRTSATVLAWDRDVGFLRPLLQAADWSEALASGRLRFIAGADLLDHTSAAWLPHPILGAAYVDEAAWRADSRPRALLVDGALFVSDVGEALRAEGWNVFRWNVTDLLIDELDRIADRVAPDVVVGINHTHGLAEACAARDVRLVEWEIDPSTDHLQPTRAPGATVWTWRRSHVAPLREAGFEAHYLPLATNPERRRPVALTTDEASTYGVAVAYVGSSMTQSATENLQLFVEAYARAYGAPEAGRQVARQILAAQAERAAEGYVLPELLDQAIPEIHRRFEAIGFRHRADALLGESAAAGYRLQTLARIGDLGLHVWGDPGWKALERFGARYRGWAGHYHELTRIYSGAQVQVDVGRLYQLDIVPMRIVDAIAAGGFVLAQHSEAIEDLFVVDEEVVTWRTWDELRHKTEAYLADPDARARVVAAGRRRVLRDHTIRRRVRTMMAALREPVS